MGTRITGGKEPRKGKKKPEEEPKKRPINQHDMYPRLQVACLNRAHPDIVHFEIPSGHAKAACPKCGRQVGRKAKS